MSGVSHLWRGTFRHAFAFDKAFVGYDLFLMLLGLLFRLFSFRSFLLRRSDAGRVALFNVSHRPCEIGTQDVLHVCIVFFTHLRLVVLGHSKGLVMDGVGRVVYELSEWFAVQRRFLQVVDVFPYERRLQRLRSISPPKLLVIRVRERAAHRDRALEREGRVSESE